MAHHSTQEVYNKHQKMQVKRENTINISLSKNPTNLQHHLKTKPISMYTFIHKNKYLRKELFKT